jgi:hypothetical protein
VTPWQLQAALLSLLTRLPHCCRLHLLLLPLPEMHSHQPCQLLLDSLLLVLLPILLLQQGTSRLIGLTHPQCLHLLLQLHRFRTPMRSPTHSQWRCRCQLVLR